MQIAAQQAQDLDAVSPVVNHRLAIAHLWNNGNVRAAEQFAQGAELGFVNLRSPGYLIFLLRMERYEEARRVIKALYDGSGADPGWLMDNIQQIAAGAPTEAFKEQAEAAINEGDVLPRISLGLWLYLQDSGRALETVKLSASEKKYLDFELLFAAEAADFRESREFSALAEEFGLQRYWEDLRGPDFW